jgi:hypothetical protein
MFNQQCLIAWLPISPVMLKTDDYLPNWAVVTCKAGLDPPLCYVLTKISVVAGIIRQVKARKLQAPITVGQRENNSCAETLLRVMSF